MNPTLEANSLSGYSFKHLPALDGLRAIAIMAVLFSHSAQQLFGKSGVIESEYLFRFTGFFRLGVDLFFAISGFLITYRLSRK